MNFRGSLTERRRIKANLDLTPLIDVVFQLVLFFMLSSTFVVQTSIQIEVPQAEGATALEQKNLTVTVTYGEGGPDGLGKIYVNEDEMATWDELTRRLTEEVQARKEPPLLLIRTDGRVPMSQAVRVWGIATSVGIERFGVAAQPVEEEKG